MRSKGRWIWQVVEGGAPKAPIQFGLSERQQMELEEAHATATHATVATRERVYRGATIEVWGAGGGDRTCAPKDAQVGNGVVMYRD